MNKDRHVVPYGKDWAVIKSKSERVSSIHRTQKAAITRAVSGAKEDKVEVVIHGRDGRIRDKDSYGRDPNPPKDKKY